jgi:hypothetical protein
VFVYVRARLRLRVVSYSRSYHNLVSSTRYGLVKKLTNEMTLQPLTSLFVTDFSAVYPQRSAAEPVFSELAALTHVRIARRPFVRARVSRPLTFRLRPRDSLQAPLSEIADQFHVWL